MVMKKRHIVGVKTKRAKKSKRKINKKKHTFKISKNFGVKRRTKKNLKLSRIQKNQLIGGGKFDDEAKGLDETPSTLRPDLHVMITGSSSPEKFIAALARMSDGNGNLERRRSYARRAVDSAAGRLDDYRDLGGDLGTLPWRRERGRAEEKRGARVRHEESLAHEERTRTVRDAAKEAAKKAFAKAERKKTDWRVVEKAAEEAWQDHLSESEEEDDEAAEKEHLEHFGWKKSYGILVSKEEGERRRQEALERRQEALEKAVEEKRRAYIAVYIVTYELALKEEGLGFLTEEELGETDELRSTLGTKQSVIETIGYEINKDGEKTLHIGGKRKRRRTRRKK
jgi:hypothetical protein